MPGWYWQVQKINYKSRDTHSVLPNRWHIVQAYNW